MKRRLEIDNLIPESKIDKRVDYTILPKDAIMHVLSYVPKNGREYLELCLVSKSVHEYLKDDVQLMNNCCFHVRLINDYCNPHNINILDRITDRPWIRNLYVELVHGNMTGYICVDFTSAISHIIEPLNCLYKLSISNLAKEEESPFPLYLCTPHKISSLEILDLTMCKSGLILDSAISRGIKVLYVLSMTHYGFLINHAILNIKRIYTMDMYTGKNIRVRSATTESVLKWENSLIRKPISLCDNIYWCQYIIKEDSEIVNNHIHQ
jgi:hypothetical protein